MQKGFIIWIGLMWLTLGPGPHPRQAEANTALPIASVSASSFQSPHEPSNTLDGDLDTRWSALGDGQRIRYNLNSAQCVEAVRIAWFRGDRRTAAFDIDVSMDARSWTSVFTGQSSGRTLNFESYRFNPTEAQYVRITGHGNSQNEWNSITEVEIRGAACNTVDNPLVWQDQFDREGSFDVPDALVVADDRIYVVSASETGPIARALSLESGDLIWQYPLPQGTMINTAAVQDGRLFIVGGIDLPEVDDRSQTDIFVRALDASDGTPRWRFQFDFDNERDNAGFDERGHTVAVSGNRVFVGGAGDFKWIDPHDEDGPLSVENEAFLVLALDASEGDLLWQHSLRKDDVNGSVTKLVVRGDRVFAAGDFDQDGLVHALNASDGQLLWSDRFNYDNSDSDPDEITATADQDRVYVTGYHGRRFDQLGFIRALQVTNGQLAWDDQILGARPSSITVDGSRVFLSGFTSIGPTLDAYAGAWDVTRGNRLWQRQFDLDGGRDFAESLAAANGVVTIVGSSDVSDTIADALVRALDQETGDTLWVDQFDLAGSDDDLRLVTIVDDKVITSGDSATTKNDDGSVNFSDFDAITRVLRLDGCQGC